MTTLESSEVGRWLNKAQRTLTPEQFTRMLLYVADQVGIAAESYISPYPSEEHNELSVFYERRVMATHPYINKFGEKRIPGATYISKFKNMPQQRKIFYLLKN